MVLHHFLSILNICVYRSSASLLYRYLLISLQHLYTLAHRDKMQQFSFIHKFCYFIHCQCIIVSESTEDKTKLPQWIFLLDYNYKCRVFLKRWKSWLTQMQILINTNAKMHVAPQKKLLTFENLILHIFYLLCWIVSHMPIKIITQ